MCTSTSYSQQLSSQDDKAKPEVEEHLPSLKCV